MAKVDKDALTMPIVTVAALPRVPQWCRVAVVGGVMAAAIGACSHRAAVSPVRQSAASQHPVSPAPSDSATDAAAVVRAATELRLAGKLDEARRSVEAALDRADLSARHQVALRLELATILDRVGLHFNTRPVPAAWEQIERAAGLSVDLDAASQGAVESAKASYFYRAEMAQRDFPRATEHAARALELLRQAADVRGRADVLHRLGLIYMQRRELLRARALFDESLALDESVGARAVMLGEYHRHVAFTYVLSDDWSAALPHFAQSLRYRKKAGAIDASLFAAVSLGSALVETGTPGAAESHLTYALDVARELPSPVGIARASMVLGHMYEQMGKPAEAKAAYQAANKAATSVNYATVAESARAAMLRLAELPR